MTLPRFLRHASRPALLAALCLAATPASASRDMTGPADTIAWAREVNPEGAGSRYQWFVRPNGEGALRELPRGTRPGSRDIQAVSFRLDRQELARVQQWLTQYRNVRLASQNRTSCESDHAVAVVNQRGLPLLSTNYGCRDRNIATRHRIMEQILTLMRANRVAR